MKDVTRHIPARKIPLAKIVFDERNPNKMSKAQIEGLNKAVDKYGFAVDPWVNDQGNGTYMVIDGEHRVRLLLARGDKAVTCKVFKVAYKDVQILRQLANKLRGSHDKKKDAAEFKAIFDAGQLQQFSDMMAVAVEDFEAVLNKEFGTDIGEQPTPEPPKKPKTKPGDVYELGLWAYCPKCHKRYDNPKPASMKCGCGANFKPVPNSHIIKCADVADGAADTVRGRTIDCVFTDPPYNVGYEQGKFMAMDTPPPKWGAIKNDEMTEPEYAEFLGRFFKAVKPHLKATPFYVCSAALQSAGTTYGAMEAAGIHVQCQIIWDKGQIVLGRGDYNWQHEQLWYGYSGNPHQWFGGRTQGTVWQIPRGSTAYDHPTQKPVALAVKAILNSTKHGDLVFDGFLGSGTTLLACEETDRVCAGTELEPAYCDVVITRWAATQKSPRIRLNGKPIKWAAPKPAK